MPGRSRSGKGSGRCGSSTRTTIAPRSASIRPTSGVAHAVPSTTTWAPVSEVPLTSGTESAGAGVVRTAAAGSNHAAASASTASDGEPGEVRQRPVRARDRRADRQRHVGERRPRGRRAGVDPAVRSAEQRCRSGPARRPGGCAPTGRHPAEPRAEAVGRAGRRAPRPRVGRWRRRSSRCTRPRSRAREPGRPLLEERGDALGAVVGGRDQQVEVGLEAQRVGEREVAPALHRVARGGLRARRAGGELSRRGSRRARPGRRSAPRARCAPAPSASTASPTTSIRSASATPPARVSRCVPPQHGSSPRTDFGERHRRVGSDDAQVGREEQLGAGAHRRTVPHRDRRRRERGQQRRRVAQARGGRDPRLAVPRRRRARAGAAARAADRR